MTAKLKLFILFLFFTLTIKATIFERVITNCSVISNACVGDTIRFIGDSINTTFYGVTYVSVYNDISQTYSNYYITSYYGTATIQDHILTLGDVIFKTSPCSNPSGLNNIFYNCSVNISDVLEFKNQIKIFPNPTNGLVNILWKDEMDNQKVNVSVKDITGKIVYSTNELVINNNFINFKLEVQNGVYFVNIFNNQTKEQVIKKIVLQH